MTSLAGKVALITGARGGLGTTVTNAFLAAGAEVAGVSRSIVDADFAHDRFFAIPAELNSSETVKSVVESVLSRTGRIDALIHLVGAFAGGAVIDTEDSAFEQMLTINLRSAFYICKAVLPHMRNRGSGRVVAIGSRMAVETGAQAAAYSASKAGLVALVRAIAAENAGHGITANIVLPGTMDTPANRKAMPGADYTKWVQTDQVATILVALASDELSNINGAAIPIYGQDV